MDPVTTIVVGLILQGGRPGGFPQQTGGRDEDVALLMLRLVIQVVFTIPTLAGMWAIFVKAGKPGWAAIVPIYNIIVLLEITGNAPWWVILYCCPIVNIVISILVTLDLARKFGQGGGFAIGMICLPFIFYPILGFGSAQYQGGGGQRRRRDEDDDDEYEDDDRSSRRRS